MLSVHANEVSQNKIANPAIKILPGFVARVRVRCGKLNCRCRLGERHLAHYRVTYSRGDRVRKYVRRNDVDETRAACEAHRVLQAQLRAGRSEYKELLAETRKLVKLLSE